MSHGPVAALHDLAKSVKCLQQKASDSIGNISGVHQSNQNVPQGFLDAWYLLSSAVPALEEILGTSAQGDVPADVTSWLAPSTVSTCSNLYARQIRGIDATTFISDGTSIAWLQAGKKYAAAI